MRAPAALRLLVPVALPVRIERLQVFAEPGLEEGELAEPAAQGVVGGVEHAPDRLALRLGVACEARMVGERGHRGAGFQTLGGERKETGVSDKWTCSVRWIQPAHDAGDRTRA